MTSPMEANASIGLFYRAACTEKSRRTILPLPFRFQVRFLLTWMFRNTSRLRRAANFAEQNPELVLHRVNWSLIRSFYWRAR